VMSSSNAATKIEPTAPDSDDSGVRRKLDPDAVARIVSGMRAADPKVRKFLEETVRRYPRQGITPWS
jgi:hypothetical protein